MTHFPNAASDIEAETTATRFARCASEQVGKRYVWASAGPDTFDCSGLVAYCYNRETGRTITRSSEDQYRLGRSVSVGDLRVGDLLFWGQGAADHVGIYVGNGDVVNALNEQRGVVVSKRDADYGLPYLGARRLFITKPAPVEDTPDPKRPRRKHRRTNL